MQLTLLTLTKMTMKFAISLIVGGTLQLAVVAVTVWPTGLLQCNINWDS